MVEKRQFAEWLCNKPTVRMFANTERNGEKTHFSGHAFELNNCMVSRMLSSYGGLGALGKVIQGSLCRQHQALWMEHLMLNAHCRKICPHRPLSQQVKILEQILQGVRYHFIDGHWVLDRRVRRGVLLEPAGHWTHLWHPPTAGILSKIHSFTY